MAPHQLRKKIARLTIQNKELSTTNKLLLKKLSLTNELQQIKNKNIELTAKLHTISLKHGILEQTSKECASALVTMLQCAPSLLESADEISKLCKLDIKKKKQTKSVSPMVNGLTIMQPKVNLRYCGVSLSPIRELPNLENTPNRPRKSSLKNSSDVDLSIVSTRSRRTTTPKVNYKINLKEKLRRKK